MWETGVSDHLLFGGYLLLVSAAFALLEIQIEGGEGWARAEAFLVQVLARVAAIGSGGGGKPLEELVGGAGKRFLCEGGGGVVYLARREPTRNLLHPAAGL